MFGIGNLQTILIAAVAGVAWLTWRLTRNYFFKSPLDNVPGPKNTSIIRGMVLECVVSHLLTMKSSGHFKRIFARQSWPFLDELTSDYPGVAKLNGLLGVG